MMEIMDADKRIKKYRDLQLKSLISNVPYVNFLGVEFEQKGDELIAILPFNPKLIGNPALPAIHGGVTATFLKIRAIYDVPEIIPNILHIQLLTCVFLITTRFSRCYYQFYYRTSFAAGQCQFVLFHQ